MTKNKPLQIRVDEATLEAFKDVAKERGLTVSEMLRNFMSRMIRKGAQ